MNPKRLIRIILSFLILVVLLADNRQWIDLRFVRQLELIAYDIRLMATLPGGIDERIVIMDIDEKSLTEIGHFPWSRIVLAQMMDILFDYYKIKQIGFDVVFPEADGTSGLQVLQSLANGPLQGIHAYRTALEKLQPELEYDRIFGESFANRDVILGIVFNNIVDTTLGALPPPLASIDKKWTEKLPLVVAKGYTGNRPIHQQYAKTAGFFDNPLVDNDGIFRRVPLLQAYQGQLYESLALAMARNYLGSPSIEINVATSGGKAGKQADYTAVETLSIGDRYVGVDERIAALVPYRGRQGSFRYVSATDVLHKRVELKQLEGKALFLGTTAPGLVDLRATPIQNVYAGVEVHANMMAGILDGTIKQIPAYIEGYEPAVLLIIGLLMTLLIPLLSPVWTAMVSGGLAALLIGFNMWIWNKGLVLPIASHLLLITLLFILQMSYGFFIESRGKRALSKVFGQYIPPELVDELDANPQAISLEGQSREMTVLFSDIRGFTSISENLKPIELSQLLSDFLTPMTAVIHRHRGTIDKYMGDAIMAFWGAPLDDPYHQKNALLASMEMIQVLEQQQELFRSRGWPEIKIGVGLNSGTMSVGNMGSEFRMAYTVLGDAVNLGSRLEGLTKEYGATIIVSESIKQAVPEFEYLELDLVRVKGKDRPVTIYQPLGFSVELDKTVRSETKRFSQALKMYRQRDWDSAEREIFNLSSMNDGRKVYKMYLDRIIYFRNNPPADNWDGTFVYTTK
ncbi:MAG TPA: adenylate/guanylate cyclase domain-containing protein [Gammaproteobacteria bacterium]|nr:adenylate/guanylate cyclase domain-containing protein [Gammaproteobacteria bacterium]